MDMILSIGIIMAPTVRGILHGMQLPIGHIPHTGRMAGEAADGILLMEVGGPLMVVEVGPLMVGVQVLFRHEEWVETWVIQKV